jgi:probable lipoprotein (TIGR04455 family)
VSGGWFGVLLFSTLFAACSTVKNSWVEPSYAQTDRVQVKRIGVLVTPLPNGDRDLGSLWDEIAKRYVNMHRDFIVKGTAYGPAPEGAYTPPSLCKSMNLEGVLWLRPTMRPHGTDVEGAVSGVLVRCRDTKPIWRADANGTWASDDEHLRETAADYAKEINASVKPFVAPSFHLLKAVLDTLPNPTLTDEEQEEKIDES